MDLATQYARQYAWRSWELAYDALPSVAGARVLDLGCSIGDQSRDLAARGAHVVGIDANERLLACARKRAIPRAVFEMGDVRDPRVQGLFDGIWASFVAAYCQDLAPVLVRWRHLLRSGGWIALTEVSGLFAHEPLAVGARAVLDSLVGAARPHAPAAGPGSRGERAASGGLPQMPRVGRALDRLSRARLGWSPELSSCGR